MKRKAIIIGATGLVGKQLVTQLSLIYDCLIVIARRPPEVMCIKMEFYHLGDFSNLDKLMSHINLDSDTDAFTCLGTTKKQAGSEAAFRRIDYDFNLSFAQICHEKGVRRFYLLSARGADNDSHFFYNQIKGELEKAVIALSYEQLFIFRPSLLLGHHKGRPLETIAQAAFRVIAPVVPKSLDAYPISAQRVAAAMALTAQNNYERHKFESTTAGEVTATQVTIIENEQLLAMTQLNA